ncbi:hypothetical protein BJF84_26030 [Rhodococcus sp. CUA-806]|nr:hypothetical protein BJF84_26030 [Rhodococcus sp. CUA-806]
MTLQILKWRQQRMSSSPGSLAKATVPSAYKYLLVVLKSWQRFRWHLQLWSWTTTPRLNSNVGTKTSFHFALRQVAFLQSTWPPHSRSELTTGKEFYESSNR